MNVQAKNHWLFLDSPINGPLFREALPAIARSFKGLMLRQSEGIDPTALVPAIREAGLEPGVFLTFRDRTPIALKSSLQGLAWLNVRTVFWGDPRPLPGCRGLTPIHGPQFLQSLPPELLNAFTMGICCRAAHPADERLFEAYCHAGVTLAALPNAAHSRFQGKIANLWAWESTLSTLGAVSGTGFFDLTALPENDLIQALP